MKGFSTDTELLTISGVTELPHSLLIDTREGVELFVERGDHRDLLKAGSAVALQTIRTYGEDEGPQYRLVAFKDAKCVIFACHGRPERPEEQDTIPPVSPGPDW